MKRLHLLLLALPVWGAAVCGVLAGTRVAAQEQHPGEYSPVDIENGSRLYTSQCITCHIHPGTNMVMTYLGYIW